MSFALNFKPVVFSNQRPTKDQPDVRTTTTNGTIHISREALDLMGVKVGEAVLASALDASETGLPETFVGKGKCHYFTKGVVGNDNGQKTLGNMISDTNNKNVISSALFYDQLGGNDDTLRSFDLEGPIYGLLADASGNVTPVTDNSPEDAGTLYGYQANIVNGIVKGFDVVEVSDYATLRAGIAMYPIIYVEDVAKQVKAAAGVKAKGTAKAAPAKSTFIDEFES